MKAQSVRNELSPVSAVVSDYSEDRSVPGTRSQATNEAMAAAGVPGNPVEPTVFSSPPSSPAALSRPGRQGPQ